MAIVPILINQDKLEALGDTVRTIIAENEKEMQIVVLSVLLCECIGIIQNIKPKGK